MNWKERIRLILDGLPKKVKIGKTFVGKGEPVFIIAEVGINHNGSLDIAKKLIDAAANAGANAVKFQKRTISEILTKEGLEKAYTSPHAFAATYGEHREKLELSEGDYRELMDHAAKKGVLFFASVWDQKSADFLENLGIDAYKIPSADTINLPLLEYVAKKGKPVLLSTGMNTFEEIDMAVHAVLAHNPRVIIFHCLSLYPSPESMINMNVMDVLRERFKPLPVGYSGHEMELLPTLVAVSREAHIVERHLTLDKTMKGGDHSASLEPIQFKELVDSIRRIEKILGSSEKIMYEELKPLRDKLAKSIATKVSIKAGTTIDRDMLTIKGPGTGIEPAKIKNLIGRISPIDLNEDVLIPEEALSWQYK